MIEDIRESKKHPLSNKTGKLHFKTGTIAWDKHIFEDKIDVLKKVVINAPKNNLLSVENDKLRKTASKCCQDYGKVGVCGKK